MSTFHRDLKATLIAWLGVDKVVFHDGWEYKRREINWQGPDQKPVALLTHHTAGAATDSTSASHAGNQHGANDGIIRFVQNHYKVPAANFTLDRDGCVHVHSAYPVWHAGLGSFTGTSPYNRLAIPDDEGNDYMLGVEIVSKGVKTDYTAAQKRAYGALANACAQASGWKGFYLRLPNHRTWAPARKVDTRYPLLTLRLWAAAARLRGPVRK